MTAAPIRPFAWPPILAGGLAIAIGDIAFAISVWFEWNLAGLQRVFQSIAVGVLGRESFAGGWSTALLGAALHLFIATMFVLAAVLAGSRWPRVVRDPLSWGPVYGVFLYVVMNFIVMPLSRVGATPSFSRPWPIALSIVAHIVFGIVALWFARRAMGRTD